MAVVPDNDRTNPNVAVVVLMSLSGIDAWMATRGTWKRAPTPNAVTRRYSSCMAADEFSSKVARRANPRVRRANDPEMMS